jgi:hypothetical protein
MPIATVSVKMPKPQYQNHAKQKASRDEAAVSHSETDERLDGL